MVRTQAKADASKPEGVTLRCDGSTDTISLQHLFPPQRIDVLAKHINETLHTLEKVEERLLAAFGWEKPAERISREWRAATHNVPCVEWLKRCFGKAIIQLEVDKFVEEPSGFELRSVGTKLAIHVLPSGTEALPVDQRRKLTSVSLVEVDVGNAEDWENGLAMVTARFNDIKPDMYIALLKQITKAK